MTKILALTLCTLSYCASDAILAAEVKKPTLKKLDDRVRVEFDGDLFTEFIFKGQPKPVAYPIFAPGQIRMTRSYPVDEAAPGEAKDHIHHRSLWFTHGDVNGISFWHEKPNSGKIVHGELVGVDTDTSSVTTKNKWIDSKGKIHRTDTTTLTFGSIPGGRTIDWTTTIHATHGDVKLGDTKEGTMGIRTHPALRLDKGAKGVNSEGVTDREMWGKNAAWLHYSGKVDGKPAGIAIFDHPKNLRHPTTWHARYYGLVAANPFGLSKFQKKPRGAGDLLLKSGESQTFRYRFVFHGGELDASQVSDLYKAYVK